MMPPVAAAAPQAPEELTRARRPAIKRAEAPEEEPEEKVCVDCPATRDYDTQWRRTPDEKKDKICNKCYFRRKSRARVLARVRSATDTAALPFPTSCLVRLHSSHAVRKLPTFLHT